MTAERYLQSLRDMYFLLERLEAKRSTITTPIHGRAITYDNIHVQTSVGSGGLEDDVLRTIEKIEKLDEEIDRRAEKLYKRKAEAVEKIMLMQEGQCRQFLMDYYIDYKSIKELDRQYRFSDGKSIYRLKKRSLRKFERVYKARNDAEN